MRHKYRVGICLIFCFLFVSTSCINCVQANEVKKEIKEKIDSMVHSFFPKISALTSNTVPFFSILFLVILSIIFIILVVVYISFFIFIAGYYTFVSGEPLTMEEFIESLFLSFIFEIYFLYMMASLLFPEYIDTIIAVLATIFLTIIQLIWFIIYFLDELIHGKNAISSSHHL